MNTENVAKDHNSYHQGCIELITTKFKIVILLFVIVFNIELFAQDIGISEGYIRETIPGTNQSAAYFAINNLSEKSVTLVGASSKISPKIEIHQHTMQNGMMAMRKKASITIDAKQLVVLQPYDFHLMVFDIDKPIKAGESVMMTLHFSNHADVELQLPVQGIKRKQHHH